MQNVNLTSPSRLPPTLFEIYSLGIIKRRLFVHGEKYYTANFLDQFWQYDIHFNRWLHINRGDKISLRSSPSVIVVVDKLLYLIGCEPSLLSDRQISIEYFDSENNTFEFLTNLQGIHSNHNFALDSVHAMFNFNNSLYLIAVSLHDLSSNLILKYSLSEKSWSIIDQKGNLLKVMMGISGSVFDNKYYCFGDMIVFTTNIYREIHIFDLKTNVWSSKSTYPDFDQFPSDRIYASLSFNETHGFLSGGKSESQKILDDLWSIDLRTLKWHKFNLVSVLINKKLESKIMGHKSAVYDESTLFIFGGSIDNICPFKLQKYVIEPPPLYKLCVYVLMKSNKEKSELRSIPLHIRKDIIAPQEEFLVSEEIKCHIEEFSHSN